MNKLTVTELSKLYGRSRQSMYSHINKGNLSKNSDGLIDLSEAIRVFGEPIKKKGGVNNCQSIDTINLTQLDTLSRQVNMLEKQLNQALLRENQAIERESFYQEQIEAMQRLLEAPKQVKEEMTNQPDTNTQENYQQTESIQLKTSKTETPKEKMKKKRSFWDRFFI